MNIRILIASWVFSLLIFLADILFLLNSRFFDHILILAILVTMVPLALSAFLSFRRSRRIAQEFPVFLRDISEAKEGGMSLISAIRAVSKNDYSYLNRDIRTINNQLTLGMTLTESLERFSKRVSDPSISRIIRIISQANESGGNIAHIFQTVSETATEMEELQRIRSNRMQVYVISNYIVFGIFLVVIVLLKKIMIPQLTSNFLVSTSPLPDQLYLHVALIQGFFTGMATGKLSDGSYRSGVKHSLSLIVLATLMFLFLF